MPCVIERWRRCESSLCVTFSRGTPTWPRSAIAWPTLFLLPSVSKPLALVERQLEAGFGFVRSCLKACRPPCILAQLAYPRMGCWLICKPGGLLVRLGCLICGHVPG